MNVRLSFSYAALASSAAMLAACSMSNSAATPAIASNGAQALPGVLAQVASSGPLQAAGNGRIYVSNGRSNSVDIYAKIPPHRLIGTITQGISGPNALAVDSAGDLFVSNVGDATVTVYPPGSSTPSKTYRRGFNARLTNPLTVAVGKDGTMYLVNYTHVGMESQVLIYPPGMMSPSMAIDLTGGADGLAVDPSNDLYVSENTSTGGRVLKFAPGSTNGVDLGISVHFAGGLALDRKLDLLVCDQTAPSIDVFPPGSTQPSLVINQGFVDPYGMAFGEFFQRLYVADSAGDNLLVYSYPDGALIGQIHRSFAAFGVAVSPAAQLP